MDERSGTNRINRGFFSGVIVTLLVIALLYFLFMQNPFGRGPGRPDSIRTLRKAKEIEQIISRHYLGEIDHQAQADVMFAGQVAGLGDPYSRYYTKEQYEALTQQRAGEYIGIGITYFQRAEDGLMEIEAVTEGSPADRAGIEPGDLIRLINQKEAAEYTTSTFRELVQQQAGEIELELLRGEEVLSVTVVPEEVMVETASGEMLDKTTGLIRITQFARNTPEQYRQTYEALREKGMEKMILDLRENTGGLVEAACQIAEMIVPEGVIVYEEDKDGNRIDHEGSGAGSLDCPLAVLVDEKTASAAEILTGAIQDYEAGTIVGTKTYGKGIVQNYYRLSDGSVLQLTTTHYFTPKGNDIHEKGIEPDVIVEAAADGEAGDPQLEKARALLK